MFIIDNKYLGKIKKALCLRLLDIKSLNYQEKHFNYNAGTIEAYNVEEILRITMVQLLPKLRRNNLNRNNITQIINYFYVISMHCDCNDLRFIDAFNLFYEAWEESYKPSERCNFIDIYAYFLKKCIKSLK